MTLTQIFLLGVFAGFTVGAPFGPSGTYCFYRSIQSGKLVGLITAFGTVVAIFIFSILAGIFVDLLAPIIQDKQVIKTIRLISGLILMLVGIIFFIKTLSNKKTNKKNKKREQNYLENFLSAFGLGLISGKNLIGFPTFLLATQYLSDHSNPPFLKAITFGIGCLISSSLLYYSLVVISVKWGSVVFSRILPLIAQIIGLIFFSLGLYMVLHFFL